MRERRKPRDASPSPKVVAGRVEDFLVGSMTCFPREGFYLSRLPEGFLALHETCTHLGCRISWQEEGTSADALAETGCFHCPCHLYRFDRYGRAHGRQGLAPLNLLRVAIAGGKVVVETGAPRHRRAYRPSQAAPAPEPGPATGGPAPARK